MDDRSLTAIEYDKIMKKIERGCSTPWGRALVSSVKPSPYYDVVKELLGQAKDATEFLGAHGTPFLRAVSEEVRGYLSEVKRGGALSIEGVLAVKDLLDLMWRLKSKVDREKYPYLHRLVKDLWDFKHWVLEVEGKIKDNGQVDDRATPRLAEIRKRQSEQIAAIKKKIEQLRRRFRGAIAENPPYRIIQGRYVIPVLSTHASRVKGIVHGHSESGKTIYIEPMELVSMNNELEELYEKEQKEIAWILRKLSDELREQMEDSGISIDVALDSLGEIDFAFARASWAMSVDGAIPTITKERKLKIRRARHPLIPRERVVPLSLELGGENRLMLITGPNTGGKTVTLKTVGLMVALAQTGVPIPADPDTTIPIMDNIFADIGDEQSIEQSLSTFSAHMVQIIKILKEATKNSLVLIDELGAGTDPIEGIAIARAVLERLLEIGALSLVTTHHGELKSFVAQTKRAINASMEFDQESLTPTYRLIVGIPGKSFAIEIAKRLGMPEDVLKKASSYIPEGRKEAEVLIKELEGKRQELEKLTKEIKEKELELIEKERELQELGLRLKQKEERVMTRAWQEAEEIIKAVDEEAKRLIRVLKDKSVADKEAYEARTRLKKLREAVQKHKLSSHEEVKNIEKKRKEITQKKKVSPYIFVDKKPEPGDNVLVEAMGGQLGVVITIRGKKAEVLLKTMTITVPISEIRVVDINPEALKKNVNVETTMSAVPMKLDLHGQRVEDALEMLDSYLSKAHASGYSFVYIVHGVGSGALKSAIRRKLRSYPFVKSFRAANSDEGGDGVTIVYFN